jgi:hypothetical protein
MIYHAEIPGQDNGDGGIILESSPGTQVYNNTIFFGNDYPNAIEFRFAATTGVLIQNNLTNKQIRLRDGATGTVANNILNAEGAWFTATSEGDLHLKSAVTPAADKGVAINGLALDYDGQPRLAGAIDIGADEYSDEIAWVRPKKNTSKVSAQKKSLVIVGFKKRDGSTSSDLFSVDGRNQNLKLITPIDLRSR